MFYRIIFSEEKSRPSVHLAATVAVIAAVVRRQSLRMQPLTVGLAR